MSAALRLLGRPRRTVKCASGALGRAPCIHARLHRLAPNPGGKCGSPAFLEGQGRLSVEIRKDFLPLSRPALDDEEVEAVAASLRSGWITSGPRVAELEERFRELTGAPHAVAVASATAGMHILLAALGIGPGDQIVTPSMTFASTVNQAALRGAVPVFAEVDYGTLQVRADDVARRMTKRTRAVIPVHFAGAPLDLDPILALAGEAGVPVIEDAAHAVGTAYRGRHIGGESTAAI